MPQLPILLPTVEEKDGKKSARAVISEEEKREVIALKDKEMLHARPITSSNHPTSRQKHVRSNHNRKGKDKEQLHVRLTTDSSPTNNRRHVHSSRNRKETTDSLTVHAGQHERIITK